LAGLIAVALLGAWATWTAGWGDDGAGTRLAFALVCGLVVVYAGASLESITGPTNKAPPASQEEPRPDNEV
jgi:hypothetical protein